MEGLLQWLASNEFTLNEVDGVETKDSVIICDGEYYFESDKDGDNPLSEKTVIEIYNKFKNK